MIPHVEWWFKAATLLPGVTAAFVHAEAWLASLALGHWPVPSLDDPKDLATWPVHSLSWGLFLAMYPAAIVVMSTLASRWRTSASVARYRWWVGAFVASWSLFWWHNATYSGVWEWCAD